MYKIEGWIALLIVVLAIEILFEPFGCEAAKTDNSTKLRESLSDVENCLIKSVYSFLYQDSYLPTDQKSLEKSCQRQTDGFKCLKEKARQQDALIKRGLNSFLAARQRHSKTVCNNADSETARKFLEANSCVKNNWGDFLENDQTYAKTLSAVRDRNFDDAGAELKHLCCAIVTYKTNYLNLIKSKCQLHRAVLDAVVRSIVTNEVDLVCEDDEKLMQKTCPKLPSLPTKPYEAGVGNSPALNSLYLFATLGLAE